MSTSDTSTAEQAVEREALADLADLAEALEARVDEVLIENDPDARAAPDTLRRVVSAAARLHARYGGSPSTETLREDVSPTEAVELACALLHARDLNPFDLALWFSRPS